jgi:FAD-dependent urate hydroxylase
VVLAKCLRDLPDPQQAFTRFETLRRPRVERIIKVAARINSTKAPGPVAQVFRDAILPVILRVTANSKQVNQ